MQHVVTTTKYFSSPKLMLHCNSFNAVCKHEAIVAACTLY